MADGEILVRIETALGNIDVAVDTKHAPLTAGNFLKYVDAHMYDGGRFHRATRILACPRLSWQEIASEVCGDFQPVSSICSAGRAPGVSLSLGT